MKKVKIGVFLIVLALLVVAVMGCGVQEGTQDNQGTKEEAQSQEPAQEETAWVPERQIEITIPFATGGGNDQIARKLAQIAEEKGFIDKPFSLVNKPGAGGAIGSTEVAQKVGDPYSLVPISGMWWLTPLLSADVKLDVTKDFTPLASFAADTAVLAVPANSPYKTFDDVIAAAKANPGKISWGIAGPTSAELEIIQGIEQAKGVKFNVVPFEGGGDALKALIGGHVDFGGRGPGSILKNVEAGLLRPIVTTYKDRVDAFPDLPTLKELGVDVNYYHVRGIAAPKDIPQEAIDYYADLFEKIANTDEWQSYLENRDSIIDYKGPNEFAEVVKERQDHYKQVYGDMGMLPE